MALARVSGWRGERYLGVWLRDSLLADPDLDQLWVLVCLVPRVSRSHVGPSIPDDG